MKRLILICLVVFLVSLVSLSKCLAWEGRVKKGCSQLGLGVGVLLIEKEESIFVMEWVWSIQKVGFFLGGEIIRREYWGETEYLFNPFYVGTEVYLTTATIKTKVKFPIGLLYLEEVKPFVGLRLEGGGFFFEVRGGPSLLTLVVGGLIF